MAKRDRDKLGQISRNMSAPVELAPYREDTAERLTPVTHIHASDGAKVILNLDSNVNLERSDPPPIPKDSIVRAIGDAFKQLPKGQKLAAYLGTLAFIAYLVASGTKLAGLW